MGHADVDLPENPKVADAGNAPAADDMLAQLAGEEIDRLLAEADNDIAPAIDNAVPANPPTESTNSSESVTEQSVAETESVSQSLDSVIAAESAAKLAEPIPIEEAPPQIIPEPPPTALQEELPAETAIPEPTLTGAPDEDGPLPLYIRVLEFLNSPLDAFPDFVRETMGKVAIATMVNAIGMLVYVRFFRHK